MKKTTTTLTRAGNPRTWYRVPHQSSCISCFSSTHNRPLHVNRILRIFERQCALLCLVRRVRWSSSPSKRLALRTCFAMFCATLCGLCALSFVHFHELNSILEDPQDSLTFTFCTFPNHCAFLARPLLLVTTMTMKTLIQDGSNILQLMFNLCTLGKSRNANCHRHRWKVPDSVQEPGN